MQQTRRCKLIYSWCKSIDYSDEKQEFFSAFVILRFFKTAFATKHAAISIKTFDEKKKQAEREKAEALKNDGRISVLDKNGKIDNVEDVDFEEVR